MGTARAPVSASGRCPACSARVAKPKARSGVDGITSKVAETERRKQRARPGKIAVAGISPQQDLSRARSNNRQPNQRIPGGNLGVPPVRIMGKGVIRLRTPSHAPISQVLVHWRIR